jgi:hypothetical protein
MAMQLRHRQYRSKFDKRYVGTDKEDDLPMPMEKPLWMKLLPWIIALMMIGGAILSWKLFKTA